MATTNVDFVLQSKVATQAIGGAVKAAPFVMALEINAARNVAGAVPGGAATGVLGSSGLVNNGNFLMSGFSTQGFAKNGCFHVTTSGTTPVSVDLTNLATNSTSQAGDATFATVNKIKVKNCGSADMTVAPGGSNPANLPKFAGTTPTLTVAAGSEVEFESGPGATVDSTHKIITITPTAGGDVMVGVGGA
jgi:hypothetical protein